MKQIAPDPSVLSGLVEHLHYKDGWKFSLADIDRGQGSEGLTLIINLTCQDSYHPKRVMQVNHYMIVPPAAYDERTWCRWLLDQILLVEQHEACEFFEIDGVKLFGPHHQPGRNPYTIYEIGTEEEVRTSFRGKVGDPRS